MFSAGTVAARALVAGGGAPTGAGDDADGATSRAVSPTGPAGRRRSASAAFDSMTWVHGVRMERRPRKCMRTREPTEALPNDGFPTFHTVMRIADATPKGRAAIKVGEVKDRSVVHPAAVRAAMSLPQGAIRNSMELSVKRLDYAHRQAFLDTTIDSEVTRMVAQVSQSAKDLGCRATDAEAAVSIAFGPSYRRALTATKDSALAALRDAMDKAWEIPTAASPAREEVTTASDDDDDDAEYAGDGGEDDEDSDAV